MTRTEAERERRRAELVERPQGHARRGGGSKRFLPLNAIVDGGWLAVLTPRELRVWWVICRFANTCNHARVSHGTIARLAGMRREHAARTTAALEKRRLLRVRARGRTVGRTGKRTSNEYELLMPEPLPNSAAIGTIAEPE